MKKNKHKSMSFVDQSILSSIFTIAGMAATVIPVAASNLSCISANKLALSAFCSEAYSESVSLASGSTSYKQVTNRASELAMEEYPNVCPDISGWKIRITAMLDQYGDEGLPELCNENPDIVSR